MEISYEVYVRYEIYHTLRSLPASERESVLRFIELLEQDPFRKGNSSARDSSGRELEVRILGKLAVYYWSDHAEKEVRIVDLVDADTV